MTTAMTTFDFKAHKPAGAFAALDPTESLAEGIGSSYGVIGYKGKIWSLRLRGENHIMLRPDDGTPIGYIDVVILRQAKVRAKSFYDGGFDEQGSAGKRPVCASIDGVRPDPDVQMKQAEMCQLCPRNEWKTSADGRKSRECQDYKRLSVFLVPSQTVRLLGTALLEPVFLRIPPDSLNELAVFGDNMAQQGWPYSSFITRISFDSTKSHPKFVFKAMQGLSDKEAGMILKLREDTQAKRITGEDEIDRRAQGGQLTSATQTAPRLAQGPAPAMQPTRVVQQAAAPKPAAPPPPPAEESLGFGDALDVMQEAQAPKTASAPALLEMQTTGDGAFSMDLPADADQAPAQMGAGIGQTEADTGGVVDDPDLDAQIAALMSTK
jgi:hypothetical protein